MKFLGEKRIRLFSDFLKIQLFYIEKQCYRERKITTLLLSKLILPLRGVLREAEGCLNEHPPSRGVYPALDAGLATSLKGGIFAFVLLINSLK